MAVTVLIVNLFQDTNASISDAMALEAYESGVNGLLRRLVNASPEGSTLIVLTSSSNGTCVARPLNTRDLKNRVALPRLTLIPEPNIHKSSPGPTFLHLLASSLGCLETLLPANSPPAKVMMVSPLLRGTVITGQVVDNQADDWTELLDEIASFFEPPCNRVARCSLVLMEAKSGLETNRDTVLKSPEVPSLLSKMADFALRIEASAGGQATQTRELLKVNARRFSVDFKTPSSKAFDSTFRRALSWAFSQQASTLSIGGAVTGGAGGQSLTLLCDLRPATWSHDTLGWWHQGLKAFKGGKLIPLSDVDALRLGSALALAPTSGRTLSASCGATGGRGNLPAAAVRENRSLLAALCAHLAKRDLGLVLTCKKNRGSQADNTTDSMDETWLLHCDPATSEAGDGCDVAKREEVDLAADEDASKDAIKDAESGCLTSAWTTCVLHRLAPLVSSEVCPRQKTAACS